MSYNNKKRVLFISYNGLLEPLLYSQAITYLKELTKELKTEVVILSFEKLSLFLKPKDHERINSLKEELSRDNISWYWLRYHKFPPILSSVYDIWLGVMVSAGLVITKKIKFIHARSYVPATISFLLTKVIKIPYIFDMRGFMIDDYVALGVISKDSLIQRIAKYAERLILKNAYYTVVLTQEAHKHLFNFIKIRADKQKNIEIIPCCVDTRRFSNFINKDHSLLKSLGLEEKFIFIYIGSIGKNYQLDKMLDFFEVACNFIPNAYFLIITPDIHEIASESLKYKNSTLFKNINYFKVNPEEIGKYILLANAGIAFYLPSPSKIATSPTKIGEYLACGVPFIVNRGIGDTEKWIKQYRIGAIVDDFNAESYQKAITTILDMVKERKHTSLRCQQAANELLSLEIAKERYSRIYNTLLNSNT